MRARRSLVNIIFSMVCFTDLHAEDNNNNDDIYSDNDEQALDLTETGKYNLYGNWDGPVNPNY
ncbi:hypothetical protein RirG_244190 [Rhizophagus irregularis DAOM 197198w]|uniref:Uncharacterized protein n=1 Tax=Rhizophagus irregularis (strain DAOM 197198w) TaxID=1432141 RepID=A0A015K1U2_RHIIW|nr:hypothetical protein RirG_244190 [Rhizophagus irregularis DAOM 197198w]